MKKIIVLSILYCVSFSSIQANIIRVNNNPNLDADYTDLQEAVDAALDGDTLYLEQSAISYGNVTINKRLIVIGGGYFLDENTDIKPDARSTRVNELILGDSNNPGHDLAKGTVLIGLTFDGLLPLFYDQCSIIRCYFDVAYLDFESLDTSGSLISQCFFARGSDFAFDTVDDPTNFTISNCIFFDSDLGSNSNGNVIVNNTFIYDGSGAAGSEAFETNNSTIKNNLIIVRNAEDAITGAGNAMINNVIVTNTDVETDYVIGEGSTDGQWQLSETSLAAGAGENGVDVGAFGGVSPYVLSGVPPIPRISSITVPTTGSSTTGLQIQVTIKSQN